MLCVCVCVCVCVCPSKHKDYSISTIYRDCTCLSSGEYIASLHVYLIFVCVCVCVRVCVKSDQLFLDKPISKITNLRLYCAAFVFCPLGSEKFQILM